jgi:hypothetical protein
LAVSLAKHLSREGKRFLKETRIVIFLPFRYIGQDRFMKIPTSRSEMDSMIVEIELTLISIIQGVALTFLIESAREVTTIREMMFWPYILAALLVIFVFWSRSVLHIITVIRWPLEFGHNFLYIACALVEALLFSHLHNPEKWFAFGTLFGAVGWMLFCYDLRLIRARAQDSAGPMSDRLIEIVERDQWLNIVALVPGVLLFNLICFLCLRARPDLFLDRQFHAALAVLQVISFSAYLFYVLRYYRKIAPLIVKARAEWQTSGPDPSDSAS